MAQLLRPLAAEYDHVFLDCPLSISLVSENVMHAADVLLVPLIPTTLSARTLDQLTEFVVGFNGHRPRSAFSSMVDRRKRLHQDITARLSAERGRRGSCPDSGFVSHRAHVRGACPGHRVRSPQPGRLRLPGPVG
ncbi:MAG: ParA family protein [Mycobacterium sp.]